MADSLGVNGTSKNKHSSKHAGGAGGTFPNAIVGGVGGAPSSSSSSTGAAGGPGNNYQSMHTPIESKKKSPRLPPDIQSQRERIDESSEDSYDNGSYVSEKPQGPNGDGVGWFHAKIKVDNSIHWANNYKIQLAMFLMLISGAVVTVKFATNSANTSVGVICGSIITMISCTSVVYTFLTRPTWRKHPNPIIFFRSLCDIGLVSVLLITELYKLFKCGTGECGMILGDASCSATAALTQFFLWSSESWFFVMAIDMLFSLQSPFTDYKRNVRRYHMFVWITALVSAIILVSIPGFAGESEFGYCWTDSKSKLRGDEPEATTDQKNHLWKLNFQSWLLFYVWLILFWIYAITVIYWAYKRLNSGLSETLRMRLRVLHSVTIYVIAIIIYWALTFSVYVPYLVQSTKTDEVKQMMNFMITCKGYFDFAVWFQMNNVHDNVAKGDSKKTDIDVDVDLSPQVNLALRCEVLYYTTTGIIQAVRDTQHLPPGANQQELYLQPQGTEENRASLGVDEYMIRTRPKAALGKGTLFIDYCPHTFQTIREHFGVDTNQYIESLGRTTKERLSEGASGAFMFFSHDQQLIVKSMSDEESAFLRSIAPEYASFLLTNPDSLLTRFYGCHAIRLYGKTFNFVVMANLFSTDKIIHRRYDIKGSWVNRSAKHPSKGKRVTCRHCNAKFVFGSTDAENCPAQVGRHEPNVVLKDNDLTARVRLDPKVAEDLYDQLVKDANFLSRLGIMDYSLLLGVHNVEYMVNPDLEEDMDGPVPPLSDVHGKRQTSTPTDLIHRSGKGRVSNPTGNASSQIKQRTGLPRLGTGTRRANTVVGPSIYYFGLIDILQQWTMDKKLERFAKTKVLGKDKDGLSALPPTAYCDRFKRKMGEILSVTVRDEYAELFEQQQRASNGQRRFM
jgi:1-phosphatidylinositol-4-phosphate 5-kinase